MALAKSWLRDSFANWAVSQSYSSTISGALNSCRAASRSLGLLPLMLRSMSNSASSFCTASSAIG